jgi:hypothetical protein
MKSRLLSKKSLGAGTVQDSFEFYNSRAGTKAATEVSLDQPSHDTRRRALGRNYEMNGCARWAMRAIETSTSLRATIMRSASCR